VQAQDRSAALLAVRARTDGATAASVGAARLVRTWAMRGTLHLLAAEDLPTALAVFGPLNLARGRRRLTQLGLPPEVAAHSTALAGAIVREHGPLDRHELAARLRDRGVPVAAEGQAPIHVVARAAHAGVLIEVADGRYGPLDLGPLPDRGAALAALGRRYAAAHAPATAADFAVWSGLPAADVKTAWPGADVKAAWQGADDDRDAPEGGVRLLPAFDEWLLGWASRAPILLAAHAKRVTPGGGVIRPVAIADGRIFATWRLDRPRRRVELDPFGRVTRAMRAGIDAEVEAIGAFLGTCLALRP
jgi:hypothetical protein